MRPVAKENSAFKFPLNDILGYQANIRVLRCLAVRQVSMSYTELADRTGISLPGIHKVVHRLVKTGVIRYTGSGKTQLITLRREHPLSEAITHLFIEEKQRAEILKKILKTAIGDLKPQPKSAWIYGNVAWGNDPYGDPLMVALLGEPKSINRITDQLRERIVEDGVEAEYDVSVDISGITQADLNSSHKMIHGGYIPVYGMEPVWFAEGRREREGRGMTHREMDARSLKFGKAWAALIKKYPEIVTRTMEELETRIAETESGVQQELKQWMHLLKSTSLQRLVWFLESDSDRADRLRQSNPFWMVVTEEEKKQLNEILSKLNSHDS